MNPLTTGLIVVGTIAVIVGVVVFMSAQKKEKRESDLLAEAHEAAEKLEQCETNVVEEVISSHIVTSVTIRDTTTNTTQLLRVRNDHLTYTTFQLLAKGRPFKVIAQDKMQKKTQRADGHAAVTDLVLYYTILKSHDA